MSAPPEVEEVEQPPSTLRRRLLAEPDRAPELIALAAAERFAEPARRYAQEAAARGHSPEEAARLAVRRHVRLARVEGGVVGIGGAITSVADLVALAWIQSRMIFFVAAAHGYDPAHPMRPAELLALHDVYPTPAAAREALDGVGRRMAIALAERSLTSGRERTLRRRLLSFVGRRVAKRVAARAVPLLSSPLSAIQNGNVTSELGQRTLRYYGGHGT